MFSLGFVRLYLKSNILLASAKHMRQKAIFFSSYSAAVLHFMMIIIMQQLYQKLAVLLTTYECPRTQSEYDNSYTFKKFGFSFINFYTSLFYIAFFKGRFFTYPGDSQMWDNPVTSDQCGPAGCLSELCIQLSAIMIGKQTWGNIKEFVLPHLKLLLNRLDVANTKRIPRWEQDYRLNNFQKFTITKELEEIIIQYGLVTMFVAAFPLAPVLALLNNLLEIRVDAYKVTNTYRRPVARQIKDFGAWHVILKALTYIAVCTNALVIALTSDFIPRQVYRYEHDYTMKGFTYFKLSVFKVSDYDGSYRAFKRQNYTHCYYHGFRYPPGHPDQYKVTHEHWHIYCLRFIFVVVFEHILLAVMGMLSYLIPKVPKHIQDNYEYETRQQIENDKQTMKAKKYLK